MDLYTNALFCTIGYMYLRESEQNRADGSVLSHLQLADSVWGPRQEAFQCAHSLQLRSQRRSQGRRKSTRLARSILKRCSPEELVANNTALRVVDTWPYGDLYVLEHQWQWAGLPELITELDGRRKFGFSMERALFAMIANRARPPSSKLYCQEQ